MNSFPLRKFTAVSFCKISLKVLLLRLLLGSQYCLQLVATRDYFYRLQSHPRPVNYLSTGPTAVQLTNRLLRFESIFLSGVEGRGFHVEGEGTMSRVESNIFFFQNFFLEKVIIDAINVIKTNKKNLKKKMAREHLQVVGGGGGGGIEKSSGTSIKIM